MSIHAKRFPCAAVAAWTLFACLQIPLLAAEPISISGIYPHLAVFNGKYDPVEKTWTGSGGECGIGAVASWAGKLWLITYPPHKTTGSPDKLWAIDENLNMEVRPESVGGTHAGRMIHRESKQLIIGPYFVDCNGGVRAADVHRLVGRMTAVMRHLDDPANLVYFFDMEGAIYEVDVHSLAVKRLFAKPVPGWHGKGGYTSQGRVVIANNGERRVGRKAYQAVLAGGPPKTPDEAGVLAEWDGREWRIIERKQFCDVTGPGGIHGAPDDKSPLWAVGWDRRSVILKLLDGGRWHTFRLPKASHCNDPRHGWYTEWPRIREVGGGRLLMDMHGMFYDFPKGFRAGQTGGLVPIASHLRYIPDFCEWNGKLVLATDDTSMMRNKMAGRSQSNLWFGKLDDLKQFGPRSGWGGPWQDDIVAAGVPGDPFLIGGFQNRCLHLAVNRPPVAKPSTSDTDVTFTLQIDRRGDGRWTTYQTIAVPASGYAWHVFPRDFDAAWVRIKADKDCRATAYFHYSSAADAWDADKSMFAALAAAGDREGLLGGIIRPAGHNTNLQFVAKRVDDKGLLQDAGYFEIDRAMTFHTPADDRSDEIDHSNEVERIAKVESDFSVDEASVVMTRGGRTYRLPKGHAAYDRPSPLGPCRGVRELESERYLMNIHGTFYEMPYDDGLPRIRPVCSHGKQIVDFCTWRGLTVLGGTLQAAKADGNYFASADGRVGLWFGHIDDLWKLGKPVGTGGPWLRSKVTAAISSDPYLMTGFDRKTVELSHDAAEAVNMTLQVDFDHRGWHTYRTISVPAGETISHEFPVGFSAHWVRVTADTDCTATARFVYE